MNFLLDFPRPQFPQVREDVAGQACYPREDVVSGLGSIRTAIFGPLSCLGVSAGTSGEPAEDPVTWVRAYPWLALWLRTVLSRAGWKLPPGNGSAFPGGPYTWLPGRGRSVPFILAWSPVHLLQEGSGPLFEPPVRGEGGERGLASQGR